MSDKSPKSDGTKTSSSIGTGDVFTGAGTGKPKPNTNLADGQLAETSFMSSKSKNSFDKPELVDGMFEETAKLQPTTDANVSLLLESNTISSELAAKMDVQQKPPPQVSNKAVNSAQNAPSRRRPTSASSKASFKSTGFDVDSMQTSDSEEDIFSVHRPITGAAAKQPQSVAPELAKPQPKALPPRQKLLQFEPHKLPEFGPDYDRRSLRAADVNSVVHVPLVNEPLGQTRVRLQEEDSVGALTMVNFDTGEMATMEVSYLVGYLCAQTTFKILRQLGLQPIAGLNRGDQSIDVMLANCANPRAILVRLNIYDDDLAHQLSAREYFPRSLASDHEILYQITVPPASAASTADSPSQVKEMSPKRMVSQDTNRQTAFNEPHHFVKMTSKNAAFMATSRPPGQSAPNYQFGHPQARAFLPMPHPLTVMPPQPSGTWGNPTPPNEDPNQEFISDIMLMAQMYGQWGYKG